MASRVVRLILRLLAPPIQKRKAFKEPNIEERHEINKKVDAKSTILDNQHEEKLRAINF
jgi:hypothetical protein